MDSDRGDKRHNGCLVVSLHAYAYHKADHFSTFVFFLCALQCFNAASAPRSYVGGLSEKWRRAAKLQNLWLMVFGVLAVIARASRRKGKGVESQGKCWNADHTSCETACYRGDTQMQIWGADGIHSALSTSTQHANPRWFALFQRQNGPLLIAHPRFEPTGDPPCLVLFIATLPILSNSAYIERSFLSWLPSSNHPSDKGQHYRPKYVHQWPHQDVTIRPIQNTPVSRK